MEWIMVTLAPASVGFATGLLLTATVCALVWAHVKKRKMRRKILSGGGGIVTVAQDNGDPHTRQHQQEHHQHHHHQQQELQQQELPAPPPQGPTPPEGLPTGASQPQRGPAASGWPRGADHRDGLRAEELAEARAGETWRGSWGSPRGPLGERASGAGLGGVVAASGAQSVASTRRSSLAGRREASPRGSPGPRGSHGNRGHGGTTAAEASSSTRSQGPDRWARWVDAGGLASGQEWIGAGGPGDSERGRRWREERGGEVENVGGHGSLRGHRGGAGDFTETRRARGVGIHRTPSQTGLEFV
ncbi:uncharacterized protein LOC142929652 [Petromyzon marinus]|uniref:uncharacterized protein LOC142929652 n=1 Tax=Petromyzon marinus TaxID=7757 RepID=UPI003F70D4D1